MWFVVLEGDINLHMLSYVGQIQRDSLIKPSVRVMKGSVCGSCLSSGFSQYDGLKEKHVKADASVSSV